jgi:hypothetical protein
MAASVDGGFWIFRITHEWVSKRKGLRRKRRRRKGDFGIPCPIRVLSWILTDETGIAMDPR